MTQFTNPLNNIKIASPCSADWEAMIGDNRQRYCGQCKLNVYNLSGMSRRAAEDLLVRSEGRVCVRYYKRADGTVLTKDCPVGWQAVKKRLSRYWTAAFSLVFGLLTGLGLNAFFTSAEAVYGPEMGAMAPIEYTTPPPQEPLMGKPAIDNQDIETMGEVEPLYPTAGGITNFDEVKQQIIKNQK